MSEQGRLLSTVATVINAFCCEEFLFCAEKAGSSVRQMEIIGYAIMASDMKESLLKKEYLSLMLGSDGMLPKRVRKV